MALAEPQVQQGEARDGDFGVNWRFDSSPGGQSAPGPGRLDLTFSRTGGSALGYRPEQLAVWLKPHVTDLSANELACRDKVAMLAATGLGQRAEIDLTGWSLMSFNSDRSVFFINPFLPEKAQIESSPLRMPGDVDHWLHDAERFSVWVHSRDGANGFLLRIDTQRRLAAQKLTIPPGPGALALDGRGDRLWLALPAAQQLGSLDLGNDAAKLVTADLSVAGLIPASGQGIYTWSSGEPSLAFRRFANGQLQTPRIWKLPAQPIKAQWSEESRRILVALAGGRFAWIDPGRAGDRLERDLPVGPAGTRISDFRLFDGGRRLLWLDHAAARAGVLDVATGREVVQFPVVGESEGLAVTDKFAYIHSTRQGKATLALLADLRSGKVQPVEVTTGSAVSDAVPGDRIHPDPSGHGLLVANPKDGVIYQYSEGMMAPNGGIPNYHRASLGLIVLNEGVRSVSPDHFTAAIRSDRGGRYDLYIRGQQPAASFCTSLVLPGQGSMLGENQQAPVRASLSELSAGAGDYPLKHHVAVKLETRNSDGQSQAVSGLNDVTLLVFNRRTSWQERFHLREEAPGLYAGHITPPVSGVYDLLVSSAQQRLAVDQGRLGQHRMAAP